MKHSARPRHESPGREPPAPHVDPGHSDIRGANEYAHGGAVRRRRRKRRPEDEHAEHHAGLIVVGIPTPKRADRKPRRAEGGDVAEIHHHTHHHFAPSHHHYYGSSPPGGDANLPEQTLDHAMMPDELEGAPGGALEGALSGPGYSPEEEEMEG
jgi:hypothetical protein